MLVGKMLKSTQNLVMMLAKPKLMNADLLVVHFFLQCHQPPECVDLGVPDSSSMVVFTRPIATIAVSVCPSVHLCETCIAPQLSKRDLWCVGKSNRNDGYSFRLCSNNNNNNAEDKDISTNGRLHGEEDSLPFSQLAPVRKFVVARREHYKLLRPPTNIQVNGQTREEVDQFKYVGSTQTKDGTSVK